MLYYGGLYGKVLGFVGGGGRGGNVVRNFIVVFVEKNRWGRVSRFKIGKFE